MGQTLKDAALSIITTTTVAHGNIMDRVLICQHEHTTLIGLLILDHVDYASSVARTLRQAVTRPVTLVSTRVKKLCPLPLCQTVPLCLDLAIALPSELPVVFALVLLGDAVHVSAALVKSHCALLVRIQVELCDDTQLVALTFELLSVLSFSGPCPVLTNFLCTLPSHLPLLAAAPQATSRIVDPLFLVRFGP